MNSTSRRTTAKARWISPPAAPSSSAPARSATSLAVGNENTNTGTSYVGKFDLTGGTLNGFVSNLVVGQKDGGGGFGSSVGTFIAGNAGSINIGAAGNTANIYVGHMLTGGGNSGVIGTADFSGLSTLTANVNIFGIGVDAADIGSAQGTVTLAASNNINANSIVVGNNGGNLNSLILGHSNTIVTPSLIIGQDYSNGIVKIASGGTLNLGTSTARTDLYIGSGSVNTNNQFTGKLDLTGATFNAFLGQLIVGQKTSPVVSAAAQGRSSPATPAPSTSSAPATRPTSTSAASAEAGTPTPSAPSISAASVRSPPISTPSPSVPPSPPLAPQAPSPSPPPTTSMRTASSLGTTAGISTPSRLGRTNTIVTPSFVIGQDYSNAVVSIASGGTLNLGTSIARTDLYIGSGAVNSNLQFTGKLDLTGADL